LSSSDRLRVKQPVVISEIIDGEVIIINLDTGAYYCLRGAGVDIWRILERGATIMQVTDQLTRCYDGPAADIVSAAQELLTELAREELISPIVEGEASRDEVASLTAFQENRRSPFQPPFLEKFTDMADLLLLDPIHEVDEVGWPAPKKEK
jgi:hypothetical protein